MISENVSFGTTEPIEGRLISGFYRGYESKHPDLFLAIRDTDGRKHFLNGFPSEVRPFCYVAEKDKDMVVKTLDRMFVKYTLVDEGHEQGIGEGKAHKLYLWEPWRVGNLKKYFRAQLEIELLEADIPYIRRVRIEKDIKAGVRVENGVMSSYNGVLPKPRNLYIDIEVDDSMGFPEEAGEFYILCVGWADDDGNEGCFTWEFGVTEEKDMLQDFYDFALQYDHIVVWNKDFEGSHLPKRCKKLGLRTEWRAWRLVDLAEFYRMYNQHNHFEKLPVGYLEVLKKFRGKLNSMGIRIRDERLRRLPCYHDAWKNDPEDMIDVNVSHAYALYVMEKAMEVISLYSSVADEIGMFVDSTTMNSQVVDTLALRMIKDSRKKWVVPSNTGLRGKGFKGAVVFPAKRGVHEFVYLFDFTSLYNRIIQSYYLDPMAYSKWKGTFTVEGVDEYIKFAKVFGSVYGVEVNMDGVVKRLPVFPAILWTMEQRRNELKDMRKKYPHGTPEYELYDSLQKAAKVVLLACYGVLGMTSSRWAVSKKIPVEYMVYKDIDYRVVGEAKEKFVGMVTHIAREALEDTKDFFDAEDNVDVIYGDTDSVFTQPTNLIDMSKKFDDLTENDMTKLLDYGVKYGDKLEKFYQSRFESGIEMKLEKIFDRGIFGKAKKQYYCRVIWDEDGGWQMDKDGKLSWYEYTKGLPLVRTDRCNFLKTYQRKTLQTMLDDPEDLAPMWDVATKQLYANELDHMLILRIGIKRPLHTYTILTPQVRAAMKLVERGGSIRPGEKMAFIIVDVKKSKPVVEPIDETLEPEEAVALYPKLTKKALDYYWKKRIWKNIHPFLDLVLTEKQIQTIELTKEKKTSLSQFFS